VVGPESRKKRMGKRNHREVGKFKRGSQDQVRDSQFPRGGAKQDSKIGGLVSRSAEQTRRKPENECRTRVLGRGRHDRIPVNEAGGLEAAEKQRERKHILPSAQIYLKTMRKKRERNSVIGVGKDVEYTENKKRWEGSPAMKNSLKLRDNQSMGHRGKLRET